VNNSAKQKPAAEFRDNRLFRKLRHGVGKAIADFDLIEKGDRIAVAVSGGKLYPVTDL